MCHSPVAGGAVVCSKNDCDSSIERRLGGKQRPDHAGLIDLTRKIYFNISKKPLREFLANDRTEMWSLDFSGTQEFRQGMMEAWMRMRVDKGDLKAPGSDSFIIMNYCIYRFDLLPFFLAIMRYLCFLMLFGQT